MATSVVGLGIDDLAVTGVEISVSRRGLSIDRTACRRLPHGVVVDGRVVQTSALAAALSHLWAASDFSTRDVIVGVGGPDLRFDLTDQPELTTAELEHAVGVHAANTFGAVQHLIIDHQALERIDEGDRRLRVLVAGMPRSAVEALADAVGGADLRLQLVDIVPFALLRSLADTNGNGSGGWDAVAGVESSSTTVVVHRRGAPRRVVHVPTGVRALVDDAARRTGRPPATVHGQIAGLLVREPGDQRAGATSWTDYGDALTAWNDQLAGEVADAVERTPDGEGTIERLTLAGVGAAVPGLLETLGSRTGRQVGIGSPVARLGGLDDVSPIDEPVLAGALGLSLAGRSVERGARRLDLSPSRTGRGGRTLPWVAAAVGVGLLGLGLLGAWRFRANDVDEARREADDATLAAENLRQRLDDLAFVSEIQDRVDQRSASVRTTLADDVAWTKLVQELATVLPDDVWLRTFRGRAPGEGEPGQFTVQARGADHTSAARWILRVDGLAAVDGLWVPESERDNDPISGLGEVSFESSGLLTDAALGSRLEQFLPDDRLLGAVSPGGERSLVSDDDPAADVGTGTLDGTGADEGDGS